LRGRRGPATPRSARPGLLLRSRPVGSGSRKWRAADRAASELRGRRRPRGLARRARRGAFSRRAARDRRADRRRAAPPRRPRRRGARGPRPPFSGRRKLRLTQVGAVILGTAGHIDHGKTALVRALTGQDTDRLAAEKERGISIELGFAHYEIEGTRFG